MKYDASRPMTRGAQMRRIFRDCPEEEKKEISNELLADHYSSTLFLVRQWITLREGVLEGAGARLS